MTEAQIQIALRDFIESSRLNAYNHFTVGLSHASHILPSGLPAFNLQQIRAICKAQEQTVLQSLPRSLKK